MGRKLDPQKPAPAQFKRVQIVYPEIWQAALDLLELKRCIHATTLWDIAPPGLFSQWDIGQFANELVTYGPAEWGAHRPTFSQHAFSTGFTASGYLAPHVAPEQWHIMLP